MQSKSWRTPAVLIILFLLTGGLTFAAKQGGKKPSDIAYEWGFETTKGKRVEGWKAVGAPTQPVAPVGRRGGRSIELVITNTNPDADKAKQKKVGPPRWRSPQFKLSPGEYTLSGWMAIENRINKNYYKTFGALVNARIETADGKVKWTPSLITATTSGIPQGQSVKPDGVVWKYLEGDFTVPEKTVRVDLRFGENAWLSRLATAPYEARILLDDVAIRKKSAPAWRNPAPKTKAKAKVKRTRFGMVISTPVHTNLFLKDDPYQFDLTVYAPGKARTPPSGKLHPYYPDYGVYEPAKKSPVIPESAELAWVVRDAMHIERAKGVFPMAPLLKNARKDFAPKGVKQLAKGRYYERGYPKYSKNIYFKLQLPRNLEKLTGRLLAVEFVLRKGTRVLCKGIRQFGIIEAAPEVTKAKALTGRFGQSPGNDDVSTLGYARNWGGHAPRTGPLDNAPWGKPRPRIPYLMGFRFFRVGHGGYIPSWSTTEEPIAGHVKLGWLPPIKDRNWEVFYCFNDPRIKEGVKLDDYARDIKRFITKYKDYCTYWAFGNEVRPSAETVKIARVAYKAAKEADPNCTVIAPSICGLNVSRATTYVENGILDWCDVLDLHYADIHRFRDVMRALRALMRKRGKERPVWFTEVGYYGNDEVERAADIYRIMSAGIAEGVARNFWYMWEWGVKKKWQNHLVWRVNEPRITEDNLFELYQHEPKLAAISLYQVTRHLNYAVEARQVGVKKEIDGYRFLDPDRNSTVAVLWSYTLKGQIVRLRTPVNVRVIDVIGRQVTLHPVKGEVELGLTQDPLLLCFEGRAPKFDLRKTGGEFRLRSKNATAGQSAEFSLSGTGANLALEADLDRSWKPSITAVGGDRRLRVDIPLKTTPGTASVAIIARADSQPFGFYKTKFTIKPQRDSDPVEFTAKTKITTKGASLIVIAHNPTEKPFEGKLSVAHPFADSPLERTVTFTAKLNPDKSTKPFRIPVKIPLSLGHDYRVTMRAIDKTGLLVAEKTTSIGFQRIPKAKKAIRVDGSLDDWASIPSLPFHTYVNACMTPGFNNKALMKWRGPDDLSASFRTAWDDKNLYVAIEVIDDVHFNCNRGLAIWDGDAVQLGIVPRTPALSEQIELTNDSIRGNAFNIGLNNKGEIHVSRFQTRDHANFAATFKVPMACVIKRVGNKTTYEMAFTPEVVPELLLRKGAELKLTFIIMENDQTDPTKDRGPNRWLRYYPSIGYGVNPRKFATFTLF